MPRCGSQVPICDVPIRFDTYKGCSHGCKYCFVFRKVDIKNIKLDETPSALLSFIKGKRNQETNWCNWDIPIHWGGMSDPFQPCEKIHRNSYKCLKVLAETKYPFIVSTKGKLIAEPEYLELLKQCNAVVQISLVSPLYDKIELGAPTYEERIEIIEKVAKVAKRVIIRIQPYMREAKKDILDNLERYKKIGVYGITLEGMKFAKKVKGMEKVGADYVYPIDLLRKDFEEIKLKAHSLGLRVFIGENRLRNMGDNLCCCGIENLEGFTGNTYNLNHLLYDKENIKITENMKEKGTARVFTTLYQNTVASNYMKDKSFKEVMEVISKDKKYTEILGK